MSRALGLQLAVIAALAVGGWLLPPWYHGMMARIMVLAVYAMGYNLAFGYTGLLSLGHALFFAAGLYAAGLSGVGSGGPALVLGALAGGAMAAATGVLALRTRGVGFMIVTLMFAQAGYHMILYLTPITRGDEGFVLPSALRQVAGLDLTVAGPRYLLALMLYAAISLFCLLLVRSRFGRVMLAMRENEERSRMLGHDPFRVKWQVLVLSGAIAGLAGAAYGLMFGYVGASFAATAFSILPLLWVLTGGAGTVLGPLVGVALMTWLIDAAGRFTTANMLVVGVVLVVLVLFAPRGILGTLRERGGMRWLP